MKAKEAPGVRSRCLNLGWRLLRRPGPDLWGFIGVRNPEMTGYDVIDQDKIKAWDLLEEIRQDEGSTITLCCSNPDFNGQPNKRLEVTSFWVKGEWNEIVFTGDTILEWLTDAAEMFRNYIAELRK